MTGMHISSLLIRCRPDMRDSVAERIAAFGFAEVAINDPSGKMVVTMETPNEGAIADAMTQIQLFDGVASAALVFHQTEEFSELTGATP